MLGLGRIHAGIVKVGLVGQRSAGIRALRKLAASGVEIAVVLTSEEEEGTHLASASLGRLARKLGLRVWPAREVRDAALAPRLRGLGLDALLNVYSLHIMHPAVAEAPRWGSFNLHPGPLPEYAGLNVPSWAIYHGEDVHGVTLHRMTRDVDAGPIAYEAAFPIRAEDTGFAVEAKCIRHGVRLVERLVDDLTAHPHRVPEVRQDPAKRTWFRKGPPHGGRARWTMTARQLVDFVRASDYRPYPSPWGHPTARLADREVRLLTVSHTGRPTDDAPGTVGARDGHAVFVATKDEWVLVQEVETREGPMSARDCLELVGQHS